MTSRNPRTNDANHDKDKFLGSVDRFVARSLMFFATLSITHS
jgi:hypothetical protein